MTNHTIEKAVKEAMHLKRSCRLVYELFSQYEDYYASIKDPTPEQQNEYIKLYFKYVGYMDKKQ